MPSINIEMILTIVYVVVDDWYETEGKELLKGKVGRHPKFKDSEVLTLMLSADYIPYPGEYQFLEYIRANHGELFPCLPEQSQYNRRCRNLRHLLESLRRYWLNELGALDQTYYLLDTKPLPVVGYKRSKSHSDFAGEADYGYCSSRKLYYWGYKLVMLTSLDGLPIMYELVAANTDERKAAETVLPYVQNATIIGDKGFIGQEWQAQIQDQTGNRFLTPTRRNQLMALPSGVQKLLNSVRERIEGVFHEIQNTGRHLERLLARTRLGLVTRLISKMASHLLRHLLKTRFNIDIQTFQVHGAFDF
ncbi:MAG: IS982 family transposase [Anaerolineae bacterium]